MRQAVMSRLHVSMLLHSVVGIYLEVDSISCIKERYRGSACCVSV